MAAKPQAPALPLALGAALSASTEKSAHKGCFNYYNYEKREWQTDELPDRRHSAFRGAPEADFRGSLLSIWSPSVTSPFIYVNIRAMAMLQPCSRAKHTRSYVAWLFSN